MPEARSPEELRSFVDRKLFEIRQDKNVASEFDGEHLRMIRAEKFFSANLKDWRELLQGLLTRRESMTYADSLGKPFSHFLEAGLSSECGCAEPNQLFVALTQGMLYHEKMANRWSPEPHPVAAFGSWVEHSFAQSFPDRRRALQIIGVPGSGKTTLANAVALLFPGALCGVPQFEDTFPYSSVSSLVSCMFLNDLRLKGTSPTLLLNLLDALPSLRLPRKGGEPFPLLHIEELVVLITSNYLTPGGGWQAEDVAALSDRCFCVIVLDKTPPHRNNACRSRCRACAACFCVWASQRSEGRTLWDLHQGKLPHNPQTFIDKPTAVGRRETEYFAELRKPASSEPPRVAELLDDDLFEHMAQAMGVGDADPAEALMDEFI